MNVLVRAVMRAWLLALFAGGIACMAAEVVKEAKTPKSEVLPAVTTHTDRFSKVEMPAKKFTDIAKVGEKLSYLIKYKGIPAGQASFTVKRKTRIKGKPVFYVAMETESNDAISWIYPVRDKIQSYISPENSAAILFKRNLSEGSHKTDDKLYFDYEKNIQYYSSVKIKGGRRKEKKRERPIPGVLQDPLSVLYYLRHFPLKVGESKEIIIGTRKRTGILSIKAVREQEITVPKIGVFDAYLVTLKSTGPSAGQYKAEIFVSKGSISLWVEKHTNIPLVIKVGVPILGTASAVLQKAENSQLDKHIKRAVK